MFDSIFGMILVCVIVLIVFSLLVFIIKRYKKCPLRPGDGHLR